MHREPVPRWRQWLPYLLVLILVPILTFGAVKYFTSDPADQPEAMPSESVPPADSDEGQEEPAPEEEAPEEDGDDAGAEAPEDAEEEPETQDPDEGADEPGGVEDPDDDGTDMDQGVHVLVLNGAGISGLAGRVGDLLAVDGWTNTEPETFTGTTPTVTTLYYTSAEFEAEAAAVGERIGVSNLVESSSGASNGIVVVLRADYSFPG